MRKDVYFGEALVRFLELDGVTQNHLVHEHGLLLTQPTLVLGVVVGLGRDVRQRDTLVHVTYLGGRRGRINASPKPAKVIATS
jgi:hypothetical protein